MPRAEYAAIVISYGSAGYLPGALRALAAQTAPPAEVVVVENGDGAETEEVVRREGRGARLLRPGRNLGFAGGLNLGIRSTRAPVLLSLNPDAVPAPDYAARLLDALAADPRAGMAQGLLWRLRGGRRVVDSLGHVRHPDRSFANWLDGAPLDDGGPPPRPPPPEALVGVTGAAGFFRRSMLDALADDAGPFDEDLGSFLEDADLGLRATAKGWRTVVDAGALCRHDRGVSYRSRPLAFVRVRRLLQRNRWIIALKNDPAGDLLRALPEILLGEAIWAAAMRRHPRAWIGAWTDLLRAAPRALRRRRPVAGPLRPRPWREVLRRFLEPVPPRCAPLPARTAVVDAVVVSYRNGPSVAGLLEALRGDPAVASTTLVDSASADGTAAAARGVEGVRVVEMNRNLGYAAAANRGAALGRAPVLLIANADVLPRGSVGALLGAFEDGRIAVVAPRLLRSDGRLQPSTNGDLTLLKVWGQSAPRLRRLFAPVLRRLGRPGRGTAASFWAHDRRADVDAVAGAFFLVRREAWEEVGGMDEDFFLWHEDADLCRRLRNSGYRIRFDPALAVVHELGASRRRASDSDRRRIESVRRYAEGHWGLLRRLLLPAIARS